jgi:hypothetical protein
MKRYPSEISRDRVSKWIEQAKPVSQHPTWVERRLAIDIGEHTYIVTNGQVFECTHCGTLDPEWTATEVLDFFKETFNAVPYEIEVTCSVAIVKKEIKNDN